MANPANEKEKFTLPPGYQPMSAGTKKLEAPLREGYVRRWIRGDATRIAKAQRAGYQFVDPSDVTLNNFDLGGDAKDSGNTDMGTRVSVIAGDDLDPTGQPGRLYLMEIPEELYEYGRQFLEDRNESIAEALRGGKIGAGAEGETQKDQESRYVDRAKTPDLFKPKTRRT